MSFFHGMTFVSSNAACRGLQAKKKAEPEDQDKLRCHETWAGKSSINNGEIVGTCGEHMGKYMGTYTKNMEVPFAGGL